jgi:hypothetical protein
MMREEVDSSTGEELPSSEPAFLRGGFGAVAAGDLACSGINPRPQLRDSAGLSPDFAAASTPER